MPTAVSCSAHLIDIISDADDDDDHTWLSQTLRLEQRRRHVVRVSIRNNNHEVIHVVTISIHSCEHHVIGHTQSVSQVSGSSRHPRR